MSVEHVKAFETQYTQLSAWSPTHRSDYPSIGMRVEDKAWITRRAHTQDTRRVFGEGERLTHRDIEDIE